VKTFLDYHCCKISQPGTKGAILNTTSGLTFVTSNSKDAANPVERDTWASGDPGNAAGELYRDTKIKQH
jgi:hypothetical protein